ncbi:MAG TPA: FAD-dependent oxidoreductase [Baekduia sp.]|nr:FAD-dependent oxidoreductase [Baekduia sp.]
MSAAAKHVLIAGGGFAALEALAALHAHAQGAVAPMLLAPEAEFHYRPTAVLTPFTGQSGEHYPLAEVAADFGAPLHRGALELVDLDARQVVTGDRAVIAYDELVVAVGATTAPSVRGAILFRGRRDVEPVRRLVDDLSSDRSGAVVFVIPPGARWALPMVELALLSGARARRGRVHLVTAETEPLEVFGPTPAAAVRAALAQSRVQVHAGAVARSFDGARLWLDTAAALPCDAVVALPELVGPHIVGLPHDAHGFLPVDGYGRVLGTDVHAAGDGTDVPYKQGGVAALLADVIARRIARGAGVDVRAEPLRPVLRAVLALPNGRLFLRRAVDEPDGAISSEPVWWPPAKVAAPHLAAYLATRRMEYALAAA